MCIHPGSWELYIFSLGTLLGSGASSLPAMARQAWGVGLGIYPQIIASLGHAGQVSYTHTLGCARTPRAPWRKASVCIPATCV